MRGQLFLILLSVLPLTSCASAKIVKSAPMDTSKPVSVNTSSREYKEYLKYFEQVYKTMQAHYYVEPDRKKYEAFLEKFKTKIYANLKSEGKSNNYVRWRASWHLLEALKTKEDQFSQFYPPQPAVKFKREVMGQGVDLGIEGKKMDEGFLVMRMEPRSDAFKKALQEGDVLLKINGEDVKPLSPQDIEKKLSPEVATKTTLSYYSAKDKQEKTIEVVSEEYYKQEVFLRPVAIPGIYCLEIQHFNRTTGEDLLRFLFVIQKMNPKGLILDLRGNPGGPPLAAREIASFFLKGGESFAYFQRRGQPKIELDVPVIKEQYQVKVPVAILVDQGSGSCSELFSGVMQFRKRAVIFGTNTAGQVLLKSTFPLDDGSLMALVTGLGYYPDGARFSFKGITPDQVVLNAPKQGLINLAAIYLSQQSLGR